MLLPLPRSTLFPYTTLFRSFRDRNFGAEEIRLFEEISDFREKQRFNANAKEYTVAGLVTEYTIRDGRKDRKSTRLNSSHVKISYAVFCLKKKIHKKNRIKRS